MFRCCLCGTEYANKGDAVKCVNKCGRAAFDSGRFVHKKSVYSESVSETVYPSDTFFDNREDVNDQLNNVLNALLENGAPKNIIEQTRHRIFNTCWTTEQKQNELNKLLFFYF